MREPTTASGTPTLHTIHFSSTKRCNLGCVFCYDRSVRRPTENLPLSLIEPLAKEAKELGCVRAILSGGEPMMRMDWREVARIFDRMNIEVSLATNGTLISEVVVGFLKTLRKLTISVSVDGDHATHDRLRDSPGAHRKTMHGLSCLKNGGIDFDVNATIFRETVSEIPFLTKLARDLDCNVRLSLLHRNGRGDSFTDEALNPEEILRIREYCHVMRLEGVKIFLNLPPILQYLEEIIPTRGAACGWAVNFCGLLANGDVSVCGVASDDPSLVAGNIKQNSLRQIWATSALFRQTRSLSVKNLKGICGRCAFNEFCGGACRLSAYRLTGDFLGAYQLCQQFYDEGYIPEEILEPLP